MAPSLEAADDTTGILVPGPADLLTPDVFLARRKSAGPFKSGLAAAANWDQIKGVNGKTAEPASSARPRAKRWDHRISEESAYRVHSKLKAAAKYLANPGLISLGGGLPSSEYMPFDSMSIKVPVVPRFDEAGTAAHGATLTAGKHDMAAGASGFDIATAFNYSQGHGSPQLLRWAMEHTELVHRPRYADWESTLTIGATSATDMLFRMLGRRGTPILSDEYTFASAVETAAAQGMPTVGVAMDDEGMCPRSLDRIVASWDPAEHAGMPAPYLVYTVPSGENPTGATHSLRRRRDIYAVCQKHDLLLIEDEPYYFLQMQPYAGQGNPPPPPPKSHADFLAALVPSYLSLDTDGRVLRMDSFSKVIAPGARVGWLTGPQQLVERYHRHADMSTQGPSGFSMLALYKLLDEHWGHAGYLDWLVHIRMEYTRRRNAILGACERFLPPAVVSYKPPMAGMFFWMRIAWEAHPLAKELSVLDLEDRIWKAAIDRGSLLMKGSYFRVDAAEDTGGARNMFFRATYAAASEENIAEAIKRFGDALRDEFQLVGSEGVAEEKNGNGVHS